MKFMIINHIFNLLYLKKENLVLLIKIWEKKKMNLLIKRMNKLKIDILIKKSFIKLIFKMKLNPLIIHNMMLYLKDPIFSQRKIHL
jgi:hypothetical protein